MHTPGPWHYTEYVDKREAGYIRCTVLLPGAHKHVAVARALGQGREMHANAHLISAAPELLEVLKKALVELDSYWQYDYLGRSLPPEIIAAIAKAEGRL